MIHSLRPEPRECRQRCRSTSILSFITRPREWIVAAVFCANILGPVQAGLARAAEPERFAQLMRAKITAAQAENRRIARNNSRFIPQYIHTNHSGEAPRPLRAASLCLFLFTESEDSHV